MYKILLLSIISSFLVYGHSADITINGENKYKGIKLEKQIYQNMNKDFSGIYIKNSKDEKIPYVLFSKLESIENLTNERDLVLANTFVKDKELYLDYKIKKFEKNDILGTLLRFQFKSKNFFKEVELFGSYDGEHWEKIIDDVLYKTPDGEKNEINFKEDKKYTFFRLRFKNSLEELKFNSIKLVHISKNKISEKFVDSFKADFQVENEKTVTKIKIKSLKNLKIKSIEIITDDLFKREVSTSNYKRKILYNLMVNSEKKTDTKFKFYGNYLDEDFSIYIENNDDKSLEIKEIIVEYYFDYLIFDPKDNKKLKLEFSERDKNKPIYDMENYKDEIFKENMDILTLENIITETEVLEEEKDNERLDTKIILNIVIIITGLLIGIFILKNLSIKEKN